VKRVRLVGPELEACLVSMKDALVRAFSPSRIVLFGSFARGDQNRVSDVDLVVIAETRLSFTERIGRAVQACYGASKRLPVEVLVYTPGEWESMKARAVPLLFSSNGRGASCMSKNRNRSEGQRWLTQALYDRDAARLSRVIECVEQFVPL
jgi:predicted nucleotidyltransferase